VPDNKPPILSNVADRMVGVDSRFPIQAASRHLSVDLYPRYRPDVPRTSAAPLATPCYSAGIGFTESAAPPAVPSSPHKAVMPGSSRDE
jgi:hypothetical protein